MHKNYSRHTVSSYRDTFRLFLQYCRDVEHLKLKTFDIESFSQQLVLSFLDWLETNRNNSTSSRNIRLAAIKSFANYIILKSPESFLEIQRIVQIPQKRSAKKVIGYFSETQMKKILSAPDQNSMIGFKHKVILSLLYDSGARVQELIDLMIKDVEFDPYPALRIHGKGDKIRRIPISDNMASLLKTYISRYSKTNTRQEYIFSNQQGNKYSRDGIEYIVKKYVTKVCEKDRTIQEIGYNPHLFRHSKASHMLNAGIPLPYIQNFLGHENIKTTQIYAKTDINKKREAINSISLVENNLREDWNDDDELMAFLNSL